MEFELADRAAVLDEVLVIADCHLGKAAASDVQATLGEGKETVERVAALCDRFEPETVVVAGDLLHSFSTLPRGVAETVADLKRACEAAGADVLVTPGNHDTMLDGLWSGPTTDEFRTGEVVVCHGHRRPNASAEGYVVGHDHPTIEIEGRRRPCYLYGEDQYRGAAVLMLPAFTRLSAGVAVNRMRAPDFQSPLVTDADALCPLVVDEDAGERSSPSPPSSSPHEDAVEQSSTCNRNAPRSDDADERSSSSPRSHAREDAVEHSSTSPPSQTQEDADERSSPSPRESETNEDSDEVLPFPPLGEFRDML